VLSSRGPWAVVQAGYGETVTMELSRLSPAVILQTAFAVGGVAARVSGSGKVLAMKETPSFFGVAATETLSLPTQPHRHIFRPPGNRVPARAF
jgi:hypothetical protein